MKSTEIRQPGVVVMVHWVDAIIRQEVVKGDSLQPPMAATFGEVVEHTDAYIAVAHERFMNTEIKDEFRGVTTIPMGMVTDITNLKPA